MKKLGFWVVVGAIIGLGPFIMSAHTVNPVVIEKLTGKTVSYDHHQPVDAVEADPRDESRTLYSFPEWYIVYSAQEYGDFVLAGGRPSEFPYFASIQQFWEAWRLVEAAADEPPDSTTNTVLWTIAVSFSLEYAVIGAYEATVGRFTEWLHLGFKTTEDHYVDQEAIAYGAFLNQTPWYAFAYLESLSGLWRTYGWSSVTPRGLERRVAFTLGYAVKAAYASVIAAASAASFEGGAGLTTPAVVDDNTGVPSGLEATPIGSDDTFAVTFPRYRAFLEPAESFARAGGNFKTIVKHDTIAVSLIASARFQCGGAMDYVAFSLPLVTDRTQARHVLTLPVAELAETIRVLDTCGLVLEHVYDY